MANAADEMERLRELFDEGGSRSDPMYHMLAVSPDPVVWTVYPRDDQWFVGPYDFADETSSRMLELPLTVPVPRSRFSQAVPGMRPTPTSDRVKWMAFGFGDDDRWQA